MARTTSRCGTVRRTAATPAAAVSAVAAAAALAAAPAGPAFADQAPWRQVHGSPEDGGSFTAVAAAGPDAVWAFGDDSAQNAGATWIHRWDGDTWTRETLPEGWTVEPDTADASAEDEVWAAGGTPEGDAVVLHYDGESWTAPQIDPALAPTGLAAVGDGTAWMLSRPVDGYDRAVFFDGDIWRDYPAPSVFQAVSAAGPDAVFAAGIRDRTAAVDRWDGERWQPMEVPGVELPPGESDAVFTDVLARSADDVVAVGHVFWKDGDDENHYRPLLARFDGESWSVEKGEESGTYDKVADDGDGGLWVVKDGWNPTMVHIAADGTTTGQPLSDEKYDLSTGALDAVPGGGAVVVGTAFEQGDPDVFTDYGFVYGTGPWAAGGAGS
ncbi:hypothetical protein [Nocardiopsis suaedae]|uniref:Uncharacterized protein n=1 Tax=Nocardiopsis suaedae TaxID=3018444 RepID=A0ABT4TS75_9ACTN|nr:hypothetical protein [Nocardiopsis suaedae]MDA2807551.1 hypothetical protein [Nocardiopsis suaedae]